MFKRIFQAFPVLLFGFGIFFAVFAYGVIVGYYKTFPFWEIRNAFQAGRSLYVAYAGLEEFKYKNQFGQSGVLTYDKALSYDGYTLFAGYDGQVMKGYLVDMAGNTVHEWNLPYSDVWPQAPHIIHQAPDSNISWHGIYLLPNGELLISYSAGNFPSGGGLVKVDKDSNVLWTLERNTHHDVDVDEYGYIYAVAHDFYKQPRPGTGVAEGSVLEDLILKISPQGEVVKEYSVLEALNNGEYQGLLSLTYEKDQQLRWIEDPTHVNNVDVLPASLAEQFPQFNTGDLMVSLRNINSIGVIDAETGLMTWAVTGRFVRPHDPDYLSNGNILLYDNLGHPNRQEGRSRIIELNPLTQAVEWSYVGSVEQPFISRIRGKQQMLPNGNVLITESNRGRLFEVTRDGQVVWEYVHGLGDDGQSQKVGLVNDGVRFAPEALSFISGV